MSLGQMPGLDLSCMPGSHSHRTGVPKGEGEMHTRSKGFQTCHQPIQHTWHLGVTGWLQVCHFIVVPQKEQHPAWDGKPL